MSSSLEDRNAESVSQALRSMEKRLAQFHNQLTGFEVTLRSAFAKMGALERLVVDHKVATTGHGPSVK